MSENEYRAFRIQKAHALETLGVDPYAIRTPERQPTASVVEAFRAKEPDLAEDEGVAAAVAGRVLGIRSMGKKVAFLDLWDESGRIQVYLNKESVGDQDWGIFENLDLGDFIWTSGSTRRTKTGEISLFADRVLFLTKALAVPPLEKSGGIRDVELRYRKRYASLLASPEARADFVRRSTIIREIRKYLDGLGFMEVETPMMHPVLGGATARPFATHHNALNMPLFLRIAPELYLKRLLVGGFERVYEVNRNFRNEGVDTTHNPEFTMLELYQAYSDYHGMMDITEGMLVHLLKVILNFEEGTQLLHQWGHTSIDMTPPFRRVRYAEVFREHAGIDVNDEEAVRQRAATLPHASELLQLSHWRMVDEIFDALVQHKLVNPTFVIDYPTIISPLAKAKRETPEICERFELFINGMEFANAFSELNDPLEQRARFEEQVSRAIATKDEELSKVVDTDFVEALEFGMPPAGGLGVGIDRLSMLLMNKTSIRDVILFPHMRPAASHSGQDDPSLGV